MLAELAGNAQFTATMRKLKIVSIRHLPSHAALKQLVAELKTISDQQVA